MTGLGYTKINDNNVKVHFGDVHIANLIKLEDGYFHCSFAKLDGVLSSWVLQDIVNALDNLNKEFEEQLEEYYSNNTNVLDEYQDDYDNFFLDFDIDH